MLKDLPLAHFLSILIVERADADQIKGKPISSYICPGNFQETGHFLLIFFSAMFAPKIPANILQNLSLFYNLSEALYVLAL